MTLRRRLAEPLICIGFEAVICTWDEGTICVDAEATRPLIRESR